MYRKLSKNRQKRREQAPKLTTHQLRGYQVPVLVASLALSSLAFGQQKEEFAQAQKENGAALKQYTWKSRTEMKMKGESKSVKLEQVRYDLDGKQQKTAIGEPQKQQAQQGGGGRRGGRMKAKMIEKKKKEFAELMKTLGQLVASYAHLPPDKMQAFAQNATMGPTEDGGVMIQGLNVLHPGDTMRVWIDPASYMMRRVEINTAYDKNPVHFAGEFRPVSDGPTYPARLVLEYPDEEVELVIENYDYQKVGM